MANLKYVASGPGLLKILTLVFGVISFGLGLSAWHSELVFERYFVYAAIICFAISLLDLIINMSLKRLEGNMPSKIADFFYHVIGGILLIVGGSLMIASVKKVKKSCEAPDGWGTFECQKESEKLAAGSFSVINGVFYFVTALIISTTAESNEDMDYGFATNKAYNTRLDSPSKRGSVEDPDPNY